MKDEMKMNNGRKEGEK